MLIGQRHWCAIAALVAVSLAEPALAAPVDGATLFANQCAACHGAEASDAPAKSALAQKTPDFVVEKLTTGSMQYMAAGLSPEDIRAIAAYLTGKAPSSSAKSGPPPQK